MRGRLTRRTFVAGSAAAILSGLRTGYAQAAPLPRTITLHVGFPAGGPADLIARLVAERLGANTGSSVIVLNKPGAGGTLAAGGVAKTAPDGGNLLLVSSGHAGAPAFFPDLPFDNQKSFTTIVALAQSPVVILVRKDSSFKTIGEIIAEAKARPGRLRFGNSGGATLPALTAALLQKELGYDVLSIPYRGSGPANIELIGGVIEANFDIVSGAMGLLASGDVRGLAVSSRVRSTALPDVPTIAETIRPNFEVTGWFGILAPAQMDAALTARFNSEINPILLAPEFRARLATLGIEPIGGSPEDFAKLLAAETTRWTALIRELGISAQ